MKNKRGVVLSLLMSLLVSGGSAMESGKGNNSKGGSNVTLDNRKNIETGKTVAGYTITAILALILGYKFGQEDVNAKEIQEGKKLNKCLRHDCERKGKEFGLEDNIYICSHCFDICCCNCKLGKNCGNCNNSKFVKIEEFILNFKYLPAYKNVAKLAKYRFLMKAQEEQKKQNEELSKKADNLNNIMNI